MLRSNSKQSGKSHLVTHLVWPHQPENPPGRPIGLGGSVYEEAHPCFPYLIQTSFKGIDAGKRLYVRTAKHVS